MSPESTAAEHGPVWSAVADLYARYWAPVAAPARRLVLDRAGVGPGTRVLDVGCGPGAFARSAADRGAAVSGIDAAEGMVAVARAAVPEGTFRVGPMEALPWEDGAFALAAAFNAVQFAADRVRTLREMARVAERIAVVTWGPHERCRQFAVQDALEDLAGVGGTGTQPLGDDGVLERLVADAGLPAPALGEVDAPLVLADEAALLEAFHVDVVDVGLDPSPDVDATIRAAAAPFRRPDGSYRLDNVFRYAITTPKGQP